MASKSDNTKKTIARASSVAEKTSVKKSASRSKKDDEEGMEQ